MQHTYATTVEGLVASVLHSMSILHIKSICEHRTLCFENMYLVFVTRSQSVLLTAEKSLHADEVTHEDNCIYLTCD